MIILATKTFISLGKLYYVADVFHLLLNDLDLLVSSV